MTAKEIEKAAYIAAHRILEADTTAHQLVCKGARRTHAVDTVADIIREVFELHSVALRPMDSASNELVERELQIVSRRRSPIVELPVRAS